MKIIGQKVSHKVYGQGVITQQEGQFMTVAFDAGSRNFLFPQGFQAFFTAKSKAFADYVEELNREKAEKKLALLQAALAPKRETESEPEETPEPLPEPIQEPLTQAEPQPVVQIAPEELAAPEPDKDKRSRRRKKSGQQYHVAFKLNYCDGGADKNELGFSGPCSEAQLTDNVKSDKRPSCAGTGSVCRSCVRQGWTREEFLQNYTPCPESRILADWQIAAGVVQSGANRGRPLYLDGVSNGSLCILTTRLAGDTEAQRCVFAVFLVDGSYNKDSEFVPAQAEYRLSLPRSCARQVLFWDYHKNDNQPKTALWGSGAYRYLNQLPAAQLLRDISRVMANQKDGPLAQALYTHFCSIHGLNPAALPEPDGALRQG